MSTKIAYQHYLRALSRWPNDVLRPECRFQDVLRRRIDLRLLPKADQNGQDSLAHSVVPKKINEKDELAQANSLYLLLEDRFCKKYPLKGSLLKPSSNPTYYSDLITELEHAPLRGWWDRLKNRVKGLVRFR
ncbi:hypothetical protein BGHDH14_bgh01749 [Blumeria hordei DH14]|uniref:Uncharacterized protein n=1 Tax=Blumeria graminis f. sp. hordei (strain DH14) TaxID=546991 RepID=N1J785_BLUG1|nr:hypothetical protein BGHDH14_bgh01749 [Blumeria hordei DH14]